MYSIRHFKVFKKLFISFFEGCECDEGYVLAGPDKCVLPENCGDFINSSYRQPGLYVWLYSVWLISNIYCEEAMFSNTIKYLQL